MTAPGAAARTAVWAALPRAAESTRLAQGRVFGDPWALALMPGHLRGLLAVPLMSWGVPFSRSRSGWSAWVTIRPNLAELVIFMLEGRDVRHPGRLESLDRG